MKAFEIQGHTIDGDGWTGEPITIQLLARNSRDAVRRFKTEVAQIVTKVTPIPLESALNAL